MFSNQFIAALRSATNRRLIALASPMILSNVSIALLGIVDTAVVGHLNHHAYLAGVALAAVVFDFLYWGLAFLRMGTSGLTAQVFGAGEFHRARTIVLESLVLAFVLAALIIFSRETLIDLGLWLLNASDAAEPHARRYFEIKIWGAPGVLSIMVTIGWFIGMQNTKAALKLAVFINVLNVLLDLIFVVVLHWDVAGVAWASVVSAYAGLIYALVLIRSNLSRYSTGAKPSRWQFADLKQMFALNTNIFIRTLSLIFTFAFFTRRSTLQGDEVLAANILLLNFQMLMALGLDGFANAGEALVGRAIGAKDQLQLAGVLRLMTLWSGIVALVFCLFFAAFGGALIRAMTDLENIRSIALAYLPWMIVSPIISVWCFVLDGIFIGATRAREMRNSMLVSTFLVFLPACFFLESFGNHGLWLAFMLFFGARALTLGWYCRAIWTTDRFMGANWMPTDGERKNV